MIDLDLCSQGVQKAILDEDYEQGAAHVHRFLSMDQSLLKRTASDVENISGVLKSVRTLQDAAEQLQAIVKHKFDEAVKQHDLSSIERFFKIFPLIGLHQEGIRDFCLYLCSKVSSLFSFQLPKFLYLCGYQVKYNCQTFNYKSNFLFQTFVCSSKKQPIKIYTRH